MASPNSTPNAEWDEFVLLVGKTSNTVQGWSLEALNEELEARGWKGMKKGEVQAHWKALQQAAAPPSQVSTSARGVLAPGKKWFMHTEASFVQEIEHFDDFKGALSHIKDIFRDRSLENWGVTIFDVPGAGKSTAIKRAALETGSAYVRLRAGVGMVQSLVNAMDDTCEKLPPQMLVEDLIAELSNNVFSWLAKIIGKCVTEMKSSKKLFFGVIDSNGPTPPVAMSTLKDLIKELICVVNDISSGASFVTHLDDAQILSSSIDFKRVAKGTVVCKDIYRDYYMICISSAAENLRETTAQFKVAVTGTNAFQDRLIRAGSEWKNHRIMLGEIPPEIAGAIVGRYFDIQHFDADQRQNICNRIAYNGRSIQFTLGELKSTCGNKTTDEVDFAQVDQAINRAYQNWITMLTNRLEHGTYKLMNQLLLLFALPSAFHATIDATHPHKAVVPEGEFPREWAVAAENSFIRIEQTSPETIICRARGFLARYQDEVLAKKKHDTDTLMLFTSVVSLAYEAVGAKGHLFERLVALELTMPNSPFTKLVCGKIGANVTPDPRTALHSIIFCPVIHELASIGSVYCVVDDPKYNRQRKVDVAFPALVHVNAANATAIAVTGEAKAGYETTELWRLCNHFFKNNLTNLSTSPRVFFSLTKFSNTTVIEYKSRESTKKPKKTPMDGGFISRANVLQLMEVREDSLAKYVIVEDKDFDVSFTPIRQLVEMNLHKKGIQLYPGELEQITAANLIAEFVPAAVEAYENDTPRKRMKPSPSGRVDSMLK